MVEGTDARYRSLTVGKAILAALRRRLDEPAQKPPERTPRPSSPPVDKVDLIQQPRSVAARSTRRSTRPSSRNGRASWRLLTREPGYRGHLGGGRLRGHRRGRQGRRHPPRHRRARRPAVPHHPRRRPHRGGARPALPLALLAPHPPPRHAHHLRPLLVRPRAGGAGRGLLLRARLDARLHRDQRLRGAARQEPHRRSSSSGSRSARRSSSAASRSARRPRSSASRSPPRTGATATNGTPTSSPSAT